MHRHIVSDVYKIPLWPPEMTVWSSIALLRPNCPFHKCQFHSGERGDRRQEGSVLKTWVGADGQGALALIKLLPADAEESCRPALCLADEHPDSLWSSFKLAVAAKASPPSSAQQPETRTLPSRSRQLQINNHQRCFRQPSCCCLSPLLTCVCVCVYG